jgi:hypothetical protein
MTRRVFLLKNTNFFCSGKTIAWSNFNPIWVKICVGSLTNKTEEGKLTADIATKK